MSKKFLLPALSVCLFFNVMSMHAITMTNIGIETPSGLIEWEEFVRLPEQVRTLRKEVYIATALLVIGAVVFYKLQQSRVTQAVADNEPEEVGVVN